MIPYLFNTTVIWLLSLVCFDLFLKRETYHGYNRAYLLLTMIAGIVMPLYARPSFAATTVTQQPLQRVDQARTAITETITPQSPSVSLTEVLQWVYIAGAAISLLFLLRELIVLLRYYRGGARTKQGRYTIVETGRSHGPFSVGRILFVSSINDYDAEQWQIVLRHEQQHSRLLHLIDMILIQAVQIVFWFHPLVYLYRRRLLLVHEYQADTAAAIQLVPYGNFLVEQTLLQRGPLPAHSFNRSPIKKRLLMLTKKTSSGVAKARFWLVIPVLLAGLICCAKTNISYDRKVEGNKITYKGNVFEMSELKTDTTIVINPTTGKENTIVTSLLPRPLKMNGKDITDEGDATRKPAYQGKADNLPGAVFASIQSDAEKLSDGDYIIHINNIVLDEKGTLAYYETDSLRNYAEYTSPGVSVSTPGDKKIMKLLTEKISRYFATEDIRFSPALNNGQPVICSTDAGFGFMWGFRIHVQGHQASLAKMPPGH